MKTLFVVFKVTLLIFALFMGYVFMTCDIMAGGLWIIFCMISYGTVYGMVTEYREYRQIRK